MKRLLMILIIPIAIAAGGAAGMFLKAPPPGQEGAADEAAAEAVKTEARAFIKIGRQTIVPVVDGSETRALMMFELAVDVPSSQTAKVHEYEPRLRDAFLKELFRMSYTGAFMTNFTDDRIIEELRRNLTRAARKELGYEQTEVLILDVMRQEL